MRETQFDFSLEREQVRRDVGNEKLISPIISFGELEKLCGEDIDLTELLHAMAEQCAKYTEDVARFLQIEAKGHEAKESGEYHEIDAKRTRTHNATIDSINILARELSRRGRDGSWVKKLAGNRAAYMKFALTLTFDRLQPRR